MGQDRTVFSGEEYVIWVSKTLWQVLWRVDCRVEGRHLSRPLHGDLSARVNVDLRERNELPPETRDKVHAFALEALIEPFRERERAIAESAEERRLAEAAEERRLAEAAEERDAVPRRWRAVRGENAAGVGEERVAMTQEPRFQHKVVFIEREGREVEGGKWVEFIKEQQKILDAYGSEGWQLVATTPVTWIWPRGVCLYFSSPPRQA